MSLIVGAALLLLAGSLAAGEPTKDDKLFCQFFIHEINPDLAPQISEHGERGLAEENDRYRQLFCSPRREEVKPCVHCEEELPVRHPSEECEECQSGRDGGGEG